MNSLVYIVFSSFPIAVEVHKCKIANIKVQWMNFLVSNAIFALPMVSLIGSNKRLSASFSYDAVRFQMVAYCLYERGNLKKRKQTFLHTISTKDSLIKRQLMYQLRILTAFLSRSHSYLFSSCSLTNSTILFEY